MSHYSSRSTLCCDTRSWHNGFRSLMGCINPTIWRRSRIWRTKRSPRSWWDNLLDIWTIRSGRTTNVAWTLWLITTMIMTDCYILSLYSKLYTTSVRSEREFWPEPEPDCYNLVGTGTGSTSSKAGGIWPVRPDPQPDFILLVKLFSVTL